MVCIDQGRMWKSLKRRIGFKRMVCCGAVLPSRKTTTITIIEPPVDMELEHDIGQGSRLSSENFDEVPPARQQPNVSKVTFVGQNMNLAMALEAERNFRAARRVGGRGNVKTLMRLIEEADGVDRKVKRRKEEGRDRSRGRGGGVGGGERRGRSDVVCGVCMERYKGAAFIPCGHTFCRVCSRELWINRGTCPFCNRQIREILDIF